MYAFAFNNPCYETHFVKLYSGNPSSDPCLIPVNSLVLSHQSSVFRDLFEIISVEEKQKPTLEVNLPVEAWEAFKDLIRFMYLNEFSSTKFDHLLQIMQLADLYGVEAAIAAGATALQQIPFTSAVECDAILELPDLMLNSPSVAPLTLKCSQWLRSKFGDDLAKFHSSSTLMSEFVKLSATCVKLLLNTVQTDSEEAVYSAMVAWILHDKERSKYIQYIFPAIRFGLLDPYFLYNVVQNDASRILAFSDSEKAELMSLMLLQQQLPEHRNVVLKNCDATELPLLPQSLNARQLYIPRYSVKDGKQSNSTGNYERRCLFKGFRGCWEEILRERLEDVNCQRITSDNIFIDGYFCFLELVKVAKMQPAVSSITTARDEQLDSQPAQNQARTQPDSSAFTLVVCLHIEVESSRLELSHPFCIPMDISISIFDYERGAYKSISQPIRIQFTAQNTTVALLSFRQEEICAVNSPFLRDRMKLLFDARAASVVNRLRSPFA